MTDLVDWRDPRAHEVYPQAEAEVTAKSGPCPDREFFKWAAGAAFAISFINLAVFHALGLQHIMHQTITIIFLVVGVSVYFWRRMLYREWLRQVHTRVAELMAQGHPR